MNVEIMSDEEIAAWAEQAYPSVTDDAWPTVERHARLSAPSLGRMHPVLASALVAYRKKRRGESMN